MSSGGESSDGWHAELERLLERHPRKTWPATRSSAAGFWLEVHEHLRRAAAGLAAASNDYRGSPARLAAVSAPRLRGLVAAMHGHHQVEDFHYFPALRRQAPKLVAGFDRLEREHATLQRKIDTALAALVELNAAIRRSEPSTAATVELAAQRYIEAAAALCHELEGHLNDEEDIVVPLLIESSGY